MRGGVPSALLSVPLRYMHSTVEMVDLSDVERSIVLLTHFVRSISRERRIYSKLRLKQEFRSSEVTGVADWSRKLLVR